MAPTAVAPSATAPAAPTGARRAAAPRKPRFWKDTTSGIVPRRALHSRTLWLNGATVVAWGGMIAADALDLAHRMWTTPPKDLTKWALFAIGVLNLILRWRTRRPIASGEGTGCPQPESGGAQHAPPILADAEPRRGGRPFATTVT